MPVKASFRQACLLHNCTNATAVRTVLSEGTSGHAENLLPVLRFVFRWVSHNIRVRSYSYYVKRQETCLGGWMRWLRISCPELPPKVARGRCLCSRAPC